MVFFLTRVFADAVFDAWGGWGGCSLGAVYTGFIPVLSYGVDLLLILVLIAPPPPGGCGLSSVVIGTTSGDVGRGCLISASRLINDWSAVEE